MSTPRRLYKTGDKPGKPTGRYQGRIAMRKNGKSVQVGIGTFATKRDALDAQLHELAKLRAGTGFVDPTDRKMTVAVFAEQWYGLRRAPNRKVRSFLDARILPTFGETRLEDVRTMAIQGWINSLTADGLSPATVRGLYATLRQMLGRAVDFDLLGKNPCRNIELPREGERDVVLLTVEDMARLEATIDKRFAALVHLGCWAGLRIGELAALRWDHIDLEAGVIVVQQSRRLDGTVGPTKSGKSRTLDISPVTVEVLRAHRRDFGMSDLVFTTTRQQRPLDMGNFRVGPWKKAVTLCGFDPAPTPHSMRHSYTTRLAMAGVDWQIISEQLGHHNASFSMNRYGTTSRPDKRETILAALKVAGN